MILSNFRKTRTNDRIVSKRIESNRIFFKNAEKETPNQTVELISYKNKKLKFSNKNKLFQTNTTKYDFLKRSLRIVLVYTIRYDTSFSKVRENHCSKINNSYKNIFNFLILIDFKRI